MLLTMVTFKTEHVPSRSFARQNSAAKSQTSPDHGSYFTHKRLSQISSIRRQNTPTESKNTPPRNPAPQRGIETPHTHVLIRKTYNGSKQRPVSQDESRRFIHGVGPAVRRRNQRRGVGHPRRAPPLTDADYGALGLKPRDTTPGGPPPASPKGFRKSFYTKQKKDVIEFDFGDSGKRVYCTVQ